MEIIRSTEELTSYLDDFQLLNIDRPLLIDRYMEGRECEVDAVL